QRRKRRWQLAAAGAVALTLLVTVVGLVLFASAQARANADLAASNDRERQRFNLAMDAIGMFHGELSKDLLLKEKQFGGLRRKLLKGAADFYTKLEAQLQGQDDAGSQMALGQAYRELAGVVDSIGDRAEGLDVYERLLAVQRRLAAAPGADYASKLNVARTLEHMAHLHFYTRDLYAAAAWAAAAEAVIDRVEREGGVCNDSQMVRAWVYFRRGDIFLHRGNAAAAATEYTRARDILQVLVYASPEDFKIRSQLADTLIQLAVASP